ncbi:MAG: DUF433 domain-containing protein [Acidobacteriaceae bacterium]|nr:DUF433 domain-containing protein [Acidobacteriaceae bacterium]
MRSARFERLQNYVEERDGGYYIAGTRVSLDSIVHAFQDGESPEGILRSFPMAGPLVRIYGAITFYLETRKKSHFEQSGIGRITPRIRWVHSGSLSSRSCRLLLRSSSNFHRSLLAITHGLP